jgi:hypothetical protein
MSMSRGIRTGAAVAVMAVAFATTAHGDPGAQPSAQ